MAAENKRGLSAGEAAEGKPPAKRARGEAVGDKHVAEVRQQGISAASPVETATTQSTDVVRSP